MMISVSLSLTSLLSGSNNNNNNNDINDNYFSIENDNNNSNIICESIELNHDNTNANHDCDVTLTAIGSGQVLTILSRSSSSSSSLSEIVADLEFDHEIVTITWHSYGLCLLVGDANGCLHYVTSEGSLVFSRSIIPKVNSENIKILSISLIDINKNNACLTALLDNGTIVGISKLPIDTICNLAASQPQVLAQAVQKLTFVSTKLPNIITPLVKGYTYNVKDDRLNCMVMDSNNDIYLADIGTFTSLDCNADNITHMQQSIHSIDEVKYQDIAVSYFNNKGCPQLACTLINNSVLQFFDVSECLSSKCLCSIEIDRNIDSITINHLKSCYDRTTNSQIWAYSLLAKESDSQRLHVYCAIGQDNNFEQLIYLGCNSFPNVDMLSVAISNGVFVTRNINTLHGYKLSKTLFHVVFDILYGMCEKENTVFNDEYIFGCQFVGYILSHKQLNCVDDLLMQMTSCGEILAVVNTLLLVPNSNSIASILSSALSAVEKVGTSFADSNKLSILSDLKKLERYAETSRLLTWYPNKQFNIDDEEKVRLRLCSLSNSSRTIKTIKECISSGNLRDASIVISRHYHNSILLEEYGLQNLLKDIQDIPSTVSAEDVAKFIKTHVLPIIYIDPQMFGSFDTIDNDLLLLAMELCDRSRDLEESQKNPFDALQLTEVAITISNAIRSIDEKSVRKQEIFELNKSLHLQALVWRQWNLKTTLGHIEASGLKGLVFDRLWTINLKNLLDEVNDHIIPVVKELGEDMDDLLQMWIENAVTNRIITSNETENDETDESEGSISRLIAGASLIINALKRSRSVLLLFQLPSVDSLEKLDDEIDHKVSNADVLCKLAEDARISVDLATKEALEEAVRLYRVKLTAASYGIDAFDPRDSRQVRAAVSVISSKIHQKNALKDALHFIESLSTRYIDSSAVLSRVLIQCVTDESSKYYDEDSTNIDSLVREIMHSIPTARLTIVVEDACSCLLYSLEDCCNSSVASGMQPGTIENEDDRMTAMTICRGAIVISSIYLDIKRGIIQQASVSSSKHNNAILDDYHKFSWLNSEFLMCLKRLRTLQSDFNLYISFATISNSSLCNSIGKVLAEKRAEDMIQLSEPAEPLTPDLRRFCSLLNITPIFMIHTIMKSLISKGENEMAMNVARVLSIEGSTGSDKTFGTVQFTLSSDDASMLVDASLTLCSLAAKQSTNKTNRKLNARAVDAKTSAAPFAVSGDILRSVCLGCPPEFIGQSLNILTESDLVVSVYQRMEGVAPLDESQNGVLKTLFSRNDKEAKDEKKNFSNSFKISETLFSRDGILMAPQAVLGPLLKHALREVQRKSVNSIIAQFPHRSIKDVDDAPDVEEFVGILQRSENHMLAVRVLFSSWHASTMKAQLIRSSILALSKKILSYRDIDTVLATSCLIILPYETMVKELKSAVPSIQSDFSRLRTVAMVGEELARMWDQENLLVVFQGLQTNARWWHTLSSLGVKIDSRAFQSSDSVQRDSCIRSIIPLLLEKNNMDLDNAQEYCRQFDIEPEYASISLIEMILLQFPKSITATTWASRLKCAAASVVESALISVLRKSLVKIHPLDYEKIRFVCTWLIDLLSEDEYIDSDNEIDLDNSSGGITCNIKKSKTGATTTTKIAEIETYRRYVDITSFLHGLVFPSEALRAISSISTIYDGVNATYWGRLPIWQLLEEPWDIIEPIMASSPDFAGKLAPLCIPLQLNKDEFYSRKIMALYSNGSKCSDNMNVIFNKGQFAMVEDMICTINTTKQRLEVWKWVFDKERGHDDNTAMRALNAALALVDSILKSKSCSSEISDIQKELLMELLKLQCDCTLKDFANKTNKLLKSSSLPSPNIMMKSDDISLSSLVKGVLDTAIDTVWGLQLSSLREIGNVLCCEDIIANPLTPIVLEYLDVIGSAITELSSHFINNDNDTKDDENSTPDLSSSPLEIVRQNMIGKFLSDVESKNMNVLSSVPNNTTKAYNAAMKANWSQITSSMLSPTPAEIRRREDLYLAFSIAVLIGSCSFQKQAYIAQLETVIRGNGVRAMRRLTARSRYRSSLALKLLSFPSPSAKGSITLPATVTDFNNSQSFEQIRPYLFCLAELHETRLPCTEESLLLGLGYLKGANSYADPKPLVKTWLHDEGHHTEVVELSRDLLITARVHNADMWLGLVEHMDNNQQLRALFSTLVIIRNHSSFASLCQSRRAIDLLKVIVKICGEAADKVEQLIAIHKARQTINDFDNVNDANDNDNNKVSTKKVSLVTRCNSSHYYLDDAPEDLILLLEQISDLWCKMTSLLSSSLLLSSSSELSIILKHCLKLLTLEYSTVDVSIQQACEKCVISMVDTNLALVCHEELSDSRDDFQIELLTRFIGNALLSPSSLWKLLQHICDKFSPDVINSALDKCCIENHENDILKSLLQKAATSAYDKTTLILLTWCMSPAASSSSPKQEIITESIKSLHTKDKSSLANALTTLSIKLSPEIRNNITIFLKQ